MDTACSKNGGDENAHCTLVGKSEGKKKHSQNLCVNSRIILK
jgi:hypothetical protein